MQNETNKIDMKAMVLESVDKVNAGAAEKLITDHRAILHHSIAQSEVSANYAKSVDALAKCSLFYALLFAIHDDEIDSMIVHGLSKKLQAALYSGNIEHFILELQSTIKDALDDYEYEYYLSVIRTAQQFIRSTIYQQFKQAKEVFDNDKSNACQELKDSIEHFRRHIDRYIAQPFTNNLDGKE